MADAIYTCAVCGVQFQSKRAAKYCSTQCKDRRPRPSRVGSRGPVTKWTYTCVVCVKDYHPRHKENRTTCSRECGWQWLSFRRRIITSGDRVSVRLFRNKCVSCGIRFSRQGSYCSDGCRPSPVYQPIVQSQCRRCGKDFDRRQDGASRYLCSNACIEEAKKEARRKSRISPAAQAARKADKKRRKAMARGAMDSERVDVTKVFERDGYRCGICGRKTLQSKRGTCHPRAPELDHIVAIALGGAHTYANVQCACRLCNSQKGAASVGQLHLFPHQ